MEKKYKEGLAWIEELEGTLTVQSDTLAIHEARLCRCGGASPGLKENPLEVVDDSEAGGSGQESDGSYVSAPLEVFGEEEEEKEVETVLPVLAPTDRRGYLIPIEEPLVSRQCCVPSRQHLSSKHVCKTGQMCPCNKSLRARDARFSSLQVERDLQ